MAMFLFLGYNVNLSCADAAGNDVRVLLLHTSLHSLVLIDTSCCGKERVMHGVRHARGKDVGDAPILLLLCMQISLV